MKHPLPMKRPILVTLSVVIAGCAAPYKPTVDPDRSARIRFVTEHPASVQGIEATFVNHHPNRCSPSAGSNTIDAQSQSIALLIGNVSLGTPMFAMMQPKDALTNLGMPGPVPSKQDLYTEKTIPANDPFSFSMRATYRSGYNMQTTCSLGVEFVPVPGADYEAAYVKVGDGCSIRLVQLSSNGSGSLNTPVAAKRLRTCD